MDQNNPATVSDPLGDDCTQGTPPLVREGERLLGQLLCGRYRVLSILDYGGMGVIYRAEQVALNRLVALKVLHPTVGNQGDPEFRERFLLEAATAAKLRHPNTVTIYDFGEFEPGAYFIAMELLEGESLGQVLKAEGALDPIRTLGILQKVCGSLGEAHANGVVHRDVKPANIFLSPRDDGEDDVTLLDFGLVKTSRGDAAHQTQLGIMVGSPRFMSPEQIRSGEVDARSDIYSLGAVLYRCITGRFLFDSPEHLSIVFAHVHDAPRPFSEVCPDLDLPMSLEVLALRCLAKDPADRFQTMEALGAAMGEVIQELLNPPPESHSLGDPMVESLSGTVAPAFGAVSGELEAGTPRSQSTRAPETHKPRRSLGMLPLLGAFLLLVAVVSWLIFQSGEEPVAAPAVPKVEAQVVVKERRASPPMAPGEDAPVVAVGSRALVPLKVSTEPKGVTVFRGDGDLGEAPVTLPVPEGESWTLSLRMEGYEERTVTVMGGQESVIFRLKPLPVKAAAPVRSAPRSKSDPDKNAPASNALQAPSGAGSDLRNPWKK